MKLDLLFQFIAQALRFVASHWSSGDSTQTDSDTTAKLVGALSAASQLLDDIARRNDSTMTLHRFEIECRGMIAVQLAPFVDHSDEPPVWLFAAKEAVVHEAIATYLRFHP